MAENRSVGFQAVWGRCPAVLVSTDLVVRPIYLREGKGSSKVTRGIGDSDSFPDSKDRHQHHLINRYAKRHCSLNQIGGLQFFPSRTSMFSGQLG